MKAPSLENLSSRRNLLTALTVSLLACWLVLMAATASVPVHNWLHGGATPQDDDCAVVLLATGKVTFATVFTLAVLVPSVLLPLREIFSVPFQFQLPLPPGRGPPSFIFLPLR